MKKPWSTFSVALATVALAACSGASSSSVVTPAGRMPSARTAYSSSPIQHIVIIFQENRTFNNLFATFPGVTGTTVGKEIINGHAVNINLKETNLSGQRNLNHAYPGFLTAYDNGKNDAFNEVKFPSSGKTENSAPYVYVNPAQIAPYWTLAEQYGLANAMFATQGSASFPAHQDIIRGGTCLGYSTACSSPSQSSVSLIDNLPYTGAWGCDSPHGTNTTLITSTLKVERNQGPFPCTSSFPYGGYQYDTLRDLLDAHSVSWKYYTPQLDSSGAIWDAFDVISPVRFGPEWGTNVNWPETNVLNDISNGQLPAMSWVIPSSQNSDHPHNGSDTGPSWVASIVNAVGQSQYWNSTAIIIAWDDWGGFYDPVPPPLPRDNQGGPGLRVPMLVVSPYSRVGSGSQGGYVSNTFYQFGSIIRYVEDTFNLGRLGTTDQTSNSIADMLNYNQSPRQFHTIGSKYSRAYFLHQKPSRRPVDDE